VGLEAWADRAIADLDADEQRSVALAVALATPDPLLLVLADPLARVPGAGRAAVRDALHAAAREGAVVVCTTPSIPSAVELGGGVVLLEAGRFTRRLAPSAATGLVPGLALELVVETPDPRALAAALANEPAVTTLRFDIREARHVVRVRGEDVESVSLAVARAAVERSIVIEALHAEAPALELATAASGALQRAAYYAAYRAGAADAQRSTLPPRGAFS
jgi:ABC-type multidrug transport system ATPase subunit